MILEQQPKLDVHRLVTGDRSHGQLCLKGGVRVRYVIGLSANDEPVSLALALKGGGHYHYLLRKNGHHLYEVNCPDCGRWMEHLYWSTTLLDADKDPSACCRHCVGATYLSQHYSRPTVPGLRADIRAQHYAPVIEAIQSGDYIAARIALEKELEPPQRLFTCPQGNAERWAYRNQE